MLGYRGHAAWRDMSEYAVHFTKGDGNCDAYSVMLRILGSGWLQGSGPFGAARGLTALGDTQKAACFSEIPLDRLDRLVDRHSRYGIAFKQEFLTKNGGARVWYVDDGGQVTETLRGMVSSRAVRGMNTSDDLWTLTPFIDYPSDAYDYRFEWEREWRVPREVRFGPEDVAFLFIPEELHVAARSFFQEAVEQHLGPGYLCPYLDPLWSDDKLQAVIGQAEL